MPDERICSTCGRTNPIDQPRCINCGERAQGMMLVAEKPATATSWWSGSATSSTGIIPAPPQVREEAERAETARVDRERRQAERDRRLQAAKERDDRRRGERQGATASEETAVSRLYRETIVDKGIAVEEATERAAVPSAGTLASAHVECPLCGEGLETTTSGAGFSFCLRCGLTLDAVETSVAAAESATAPTPVVAAQETTRTAPQTAATAAGTATRRVTGATTVAVTESGTVGVSPGLAAVMSFFLPGIGQLVNGQVAKAALLFLAMFVLLFSFHLSPLGFVGIAARLMAAVDAYRIAERRRSGGPVRDGEWDLG